MVEPHLALVRSTGSTATQVKRLHKIGHATTQTLRETQQHIKARREDPALHVADVRNGRVTSGSKIRLRQMTCQSQVAQMAAEDLVFGFSR